MHALLLVAIGCAVGGVTRYGCSGLIARACGETFPWGTLVVNTVGSFLLGAVLIRLTAMGADADTWSLLLASGFCGGFTTVSSLSLQTLFLLQAGARWRAAANIALNLVFGLAAAAAGMWLAQA
jgi:CrcB protein